MKVQGLEMHLHDEGIVPNSELEDLLDRIAKLPEEQRQRLVNSLMKDQAGTQSGVCVLLGNGHNYNWSPKMVVQFGAGNEELMRMIVSALTDEIRNSI